MNASRRRLMQVGDGLPRLSFSQIEAPGKVSWNTGTTASVIFVPHRGACPGCARYGEQLGSAVDGLREWATRAMVLVPSGEVGTPAPGVYQLADGDGAGRAQLGVDDDQAAVVQSDRWGAVYEVGTAGPGDADHDGLPAPQDLVALAQFIDIQCPECGVPSQEWLSASPFPLG